MHKNLWVKVPIVLLLFLFVILSVVPFYMMFMMSTYVSEELFHKLRFIPGDYLIENLKTIAESSFARYYANSIAIAVPTTIGSVLVSAMAGYGFSKFRFRHNHRLFAFVLATMMVPTQVGIVAFVIEMKYFGWLNTLLPMIVPAMANAFGVFWIKQYLDTTLPKEVVENARIEGCNELPIFFRIVLPYSSSAVITLALLAFFNSWNNYITPLVVLTDEKKYTLPLGVAMLSAMFRTDYAAQILALAIGTVPLIVIFLCGAKYFVSGLTAGAVKG